MLAWPFIRYNQHPERLSENCTNLEMSGLSLSPCSHCYDETWLGRIADCVVFMTGQEDFSHTIVNNLVILNPAECCTQISLFSVHIAENIPQALLKQSFCSTLQEHFCCLQWHCSIKSLSQGWWKIGIPFAFGTACTLAYLLEGTAPWSSQA